MNTETADVLTKASEVLSALAGKSLDILTITKPPDLQYARNLAKVVSKFSPFVGNMIEFSIVSLLNQTGGWPNNGYWVRQDPGFPDIMFVGSIDPMPGIEIKTWFPLATEITARFKDSILHFEHDQTNVAVVAWLPEYLVYGKPKLIDVWIGSARSLALARDTHYHNPPEYLVIEPEDTSSRTANLQQTNTNGYRFQEGPERLLRAAQEVEQWGVGGKAYRTTPDYQNRLRGLLSRYRYRLDTNFSKIDRIQHSGLEEFKQRVLSFTMLGYTILEWKRRNLLSSEGALQTLLELE